MERVCFDFTLWRPTKGLKKKKALEMEKNKQGVHNMICTSQSSSGTEISKHLIYTLILQMKKKVKSLSRVSLRPHRL